MNNYAKLLNLFFQNFYLQFYTLFVQKQNYVEDLFILRRHFKSETFDFYDE